MINVCGAVRFSGGSDAFAERIEGDSYALTIDGFGDAKGVFKFRSGNETGIEAGAKAGVFEEAAQGAIVREGNEGGPEDWHDLHLPMTAGWTHNVWTNQCRTR